jgi:hypothetical protein
MLAGVLFVISKQFKRCQWNTKRKRKAGDGVVVCYSGKAGLIDNAGCTLPNNQGTVISRLYL